MAPKRPSKRFRIPGRIKYMAPKHLEPQTEAILRHYNSIGEQAEREIRGRGGLLGIRVFNNWIKRAAIHLSIEFLSIENLIVLDLCCGKGGDLRKWTHPYVRQYIGLDVANELLAIAEKRYKEIKEERIEPTYEARFACIDCFKKGALIPFGSFHIISCMFAFHYSFETKEKVKTALSNISKSLLKGGCFILTIPNHEIVKKISICSSSQHGKYETPLYEIEVQTNWNPDPTYQSLKYKFFLKNSVNKLSENSIPVETLENLANDYGLSLTLNRSFLDFYSDIKEKKIKELECLNPSPFIEQSSIRFKELINFYVCLFFIKN